MHVTVNLVSCVPSRPAIVRPHPLTRRARLFGWGLGIGPARDEVEARLGRPWRPAQNARRNLPALQKFSQSFSKFRLHLKESVWLAGSLKFTVLSSVCSQHISDDRVLLQGKLCLFCSV